MRKFAATISCIIDFYLKIKDVEKDGRIASALIKVIPNRP